jgi:hypothetical protein
MLPIRQIRDDRITELQLAGCDIGVAGATILADLLQYSERLEVMDLLID